MPPLDLSLTFPSSITSITSMRKTNGEISNRRGVTLTASLSSRQVPSHLLSRVGPRLL